MKKIALYRANRRNRPHSLNQRGLGFVELLIAMTAALVILTTITSLNSQYVKQSRQQTIGFGIDIFRQNLMTILLDNTSWTNTKMANLSTAAYPLGQSDCLINGTINCPTNDQISPQTVKPLALFDSSNTLYYNGTNPSQGVNTYGLPCTTYVSPPAVPTDNCVFQFQLTWAATSCALCSNPTLATISGQLITNMGNNMSTALNSSLHGFANSLALTRAR